MRFAVATAADLAAADAVIVPVFAGGRVPANLPRALRAKAELVAAKTQAGTLYGVVTHLAGRPERLVLVGAGAPGEMSTERLWRIASAGVRSLLRTKARRVVIVVDPLAEAALGADVAVAAIAEGATYAMWRPEAHRSTVAALPPIGRVAVLAGTVAARALRRGAAVGEAANFTRRLANEPGNLMTPSAVAAEAVALANARGLECQVFDERRCRAIGMHSFLSVAQGSPEPPRFIVLRHRGGAGPGWDLALVGKGITFDTGGNSIKHAEGMHRMKADMTGAAAVIGAMGAIARLKVKANVIAVAPCTENLPGGTATKPGDVFTSLSGKTVEVINTDAEGRLVLIDAITYVQREGATRIVDIATLTGAIHIALGDHFSGLFGRPDAFIERVRSIASTAGDRLWPMPLTDEYRDAVRSDVADLRNSAGRDGGAIMGAAFLDAVVDRGAEWAHLDIASQDWMDRERSHSPRGVQAPGVRTLIALAEDAARR